ncbi:MAG TPA: hypothetical protein VHB48_07860, partial [Chitinophagaceae bacterium]|nr:hypothetical protein [Chitinophagaceae bacterium]
MKHIILAFCVSIFFSAAFAQGPDINTSLKEASNLEKQLKDVEALAKYKAILTAAPNNVMVLVKCTEIDCNIGDRQVKPGDRQAYYSEAFNYAQQAFNADSTTADANYAICLATGKLAGIETDNKKRIDLWRKIKQYADKALALNPAHARANYLEGKWNYDIVTLPSLKLTETKAFHKGFADADIDSAIIYMEKCRAAEQYFAPDYLVLAKAYKFKKRPAQAIEVLEKLVRLPTRTPNDVAIKAEGQQMLSEMR